MGPDAERMALAAGVGMDEEHCFLDSELERLAQTLRERDHMLGCAQLAEVAQRLDRYIRRKERALSFVLHHAGAFTSPSFERVQAEHAGVRRLVARVAAAIDQADGRTAAELVGKLRSVLFVLSAKEDRLLHPQSAAVSGAH